MPWTENDYPDSLKNLSKPVRKKAIEIANALVRDEGFPDGRAIAIATSQAEQWANNRDIPLKSRSAPKDSQVGTDKGTDVHVVVHDDGWAVREAGAEQPDSVHESKDAAIERGRELARENNAVLSVHRQDGRIGRRETRRKMTGDADYHVLPHERGWAVRLGDSDRAIEVKPTKREAIDRAIEMARNQHGTLAIHKKDGDIQETRNYASPPPRQ